MKRAASRGERVIATAEGNGPVNALDEALRMALSQHFPQLADFELADYKVRILEGSHGTGAITRVLVETHGDEGRDWTTVGVHENVVEASWHALVDALAYGLADRAPRPASGRLSGDSATGAAGRTPKSGPQGPAGDRAQLVHDLDQHGELLQGVEGGRCAGRVDPLEQLQADEGGRDRPGQSGRVGQVGQRGRRQQPAQDRLDLGDPEGERPGGRPGQLLVALRAGQQLGQHGDVAQGPLLIVQAPADREQLAQRPDRGQLLAVALHPGPGRREAGLGEQVVDAAEVVEDERLVDAGGAGHGAGRDAGDAVAADRRQRTVDQLLPGVGHRSTPSLVPGPWCRSGRAGGARRPDRPR